MRASGDSQTVCIEAAVFEKQVGDPVWRGEVLGAVCARTRTEGAAEEVRAPFDGIIGRVFFDGEHSELLIVLRK